jgi:hypothetical protein
VSLFVKIEREDTRLRTYLDGSIGESTPLFILPLAGVTSITVDLSNVHSTNSIGVKHWILWTLRIPKSCTVKLVNCPYMIVSQANIVVGFLSPGMTLESFRAPYVCEECGVEFIRTLTRGKDYDYASTTKPYAINLPSHIECPKCKKTELTPDFFLEKTFKFLM